MYIKYYTRKLFILQEKSEDYLEYEVGIKSRHYIIEHYAERAGQFFHPLRGGRF